MDVEAGVAGEPVLDFRGLVRSVVVADQVHVQAGRDGLVDPLEEFQELLVPVAAVPSVPRLKLRWLILLVCWVACLELGKVVSE